jgi:hypothetical protein
MSKSRILSHGRHITIQKGLTLSCPGVVRHPDRPSTTGKRSQPARGRCRRRPGREGRHRKCESLVPHGVVTFTENSTGPRGADVTACWTPSSPQQRVSLRWPACQAQDHNLIEFAAVPSGIERRGDPARPSTIKSRFASLASEAAAGTTRRSDEPTPRSSAAPAMRREPAVRSAVAAPDVELAAAGVKLESGSNT